MKRVSVCLSCVFVLSIALVGCHESGQKIENPVEVYVEGADEFPDSLAGTWRANKRSWEFVLEPNGKISSLVHTIAEMKLQPGEIMRKPLIEKGEAVFEPGRWMVQYDAFANELTIEIHLDRFRMQSGVSIVSGHSRDLFIGPISEDGKSWRAEWYSYPEYVITTDIYKDQILKDDPNYNPKETLIFSKVDKSE